MRTKSFRFGKWTFRTYVKSVGNGYETGFYCFDAKPIFVGNFIHESEARQWFGLMNREISQFIRKYKFAQKFPIHWFKNFFSNHLYKSYYSFLDRLFSRYNRSYQRAYVRDLAKYRRMKKSWQSKEVSWVKAA